MTAMLDVALHAEQGPVPLADISERQGISLSYLEQLFARLRKHGLVSSVRGPGGGYRLGLAPGEISVGQVITAVDESVELTLRVNVAQAAYPSVTNVVVVDSPAEKTPESVLTDDATVEVRAADPLAVTGGDLATGLLTGVALMLLLGAAVYAYGRRQRGAHAA